MATKGVNPFAKTQKPGKDGDKKPMPWMKDGGGVKKMARGGGVEVKGKTRGKMC